MQASVKSAWPGFIRAREGVTNWLYPDTHRDSNGNWAPLPTTGTGNMLGDANGNLTPFGLSLPWKKMPPVNGKSPSDSDIINCTRWATEADIKAEWTRLKSLGLIGSGYAYESHASIWLEQSVIDFLLQGTTNDLWTQLKLGFPQIETWPADAQLALMDMAWWMGSSFYDSWPRLTSYLRAKNFYGAAANCISAAHAQRDLDHQRLFRNAGANLCLKISAVYLWFPNPVVFHTDGATQAFPDSVVVSVVANATSDVFTRHGWIVQGMLADLGFYLYAQDGLFGQASRDAFNRFCTSRGLPRSITVASVNQLSQEAKWYIPAS